MNRRDFLLFRTGEKDNVVELSCERLYMRYVEAQAIAGQRGDELGAVGELWDGEPPTVIEERTPEELFQDLDRDLRDADVLRVLDSSWLVGGEFRDKFEALLASFRARGGRVEFSRPMASSSSGRGNR